MSEEIHVEEHSSPVKTPKQLAIVIGLAFAVPIIIIALVAKLATMSFDPQTADSGMSPEAIAKRLKPVGEVVLMSKEEREAKLAAAKQATPPPAPTPDTAAKAAAPASAPAADAGKGKSVYESACAACHGAGVAGAPRFGDKAAWATRIKTGLDALHASALKGKGAMPPKGGNPSLSDADVQAAVDYMVSQAK